MFLSIFFQPQKEFATFLGVASFLKGETSNSFFFHFFLPSLPLLGEFFVVSVRLGET